jgi:hypothetical protein
MTVEIETQTLPAWEERFFAGITLQTATETAKIAERAHETASKAYTASLTGHDRDRQIVARVNFSHSLKRFQATQRNLKKAQVESNRTHTVTFAQ